MTIPLKHRPDGLGEFEPNDVVPVEHGGTGVSTILDAQNVLGISDKLDRSEYIQHFKGIFNSYAALTAVLPTANDGDYAHIDSGTGFDRMVAIWDSSDNKWVISQANAGANTDEVPEGSQNLYFKNQRVLATILEGLVAGTNAEILPADNVITAFQKLQAQIKALNTVWVRADTIGTFNTSTGYGNGQINGAPAYLEFAKINGNLWVRGFIKIPYGNGLAYTLTDKTYNVLTQNDSTSVILSFFMYLSPSPTRIWLRSNTKVSDQQTASNATQTFVIPDNSTEGVYHITAQCLGKLGI